MTKAKAKVTEVVRGLGVHSGLVLIRKQSKSGYYGVIPVGKRWQARVYKPDKLPKPGWDPLDTFDTAYTRRRLLQRGPRKILRPA